MSMWLCRAGSSGEFENKFLEENRIYCTWDNLSDVPFATYGGSGMGKTAQILSKICPTPPKPSSATSSIWASTSSTPPTAIPPTPCAARPIESRCGTWRLSVESKSWQRGTGARCSRSLWPGTGPRGVASPIVGGTKMSHYDDAADALDVTLTPEEVVYLEEPYLPHRVVGAVDHNPPEGVMLPDEKK